MSGLSGLLIPIPSSCCREQSGGFRQCNQVSHHLGSSGETESGSIEGKGITSPICRRTEFQGWEYQPATTLGVQSHDWRVTESHYASTDYAECR